MQWMPKQQFYGLLDGKSYAHTFVNKTDGFMIWESLKDFINSWNKTQYLLYGTSIGAGTYL